MAQHDDVIDPPQSYVVDFERRAVLYTADGKALVRQAGFVRGVQTTGVNAPLSDNTQRRPRPKKGKR